MRRSTAVVLVLGAAVLACGREPLDDGRTGAGGSGAAGNGAGAGAGGSAGSLGSAGAVPPNHRPSASACPTFPPPAVSACPTPTSSPATTPCMFDADCTFGTDGRCQGHLPFGGCTCTYDGCFADGDCAADEVCACSGSYSGNACIKSGCHVDADCGAGGDCSPVADPCTGIVQTYACHRPGDVCVVDADCPGERCAFDETLQRWACGPAPACPL